jgi:aryl-alcohol dehydrogenase-like predicted oxidoreductase
MDQLPLGQQGLIVSRLALGCMGMSEFYVGSTPTDCKATIRAALENGITFFDTADMYGPFTNEILVGSCLKHYRSEVVLATKFGYVRKSDGTRLGLNGKPEYVRAACEASLRRLRTDYIDLYYLHRLDRRVPVEDTVGAMSELVKAGKVRHIGLSEVSASTLRRAHAVFPVSAVQTEFSLVSRDAEVELLDVLRALGVGFVGYAPLGRGLLTGRFSTTAHVPATDYRHTTPRFSPDNLVHNAALVKILELLSHGAGTTPAQLALAWARYKVEGVGAVLVGTTNPKRLLENISAFDIQLDPTTLAALDEAFPIGVARGERYPDMSRVNL